MSEFSNGGITGDYWAHQPRGWGDVFRCLLGQHRPAMSGTLGNGRFIERCTCGALRGYGPYWMSPERRLKRVSREESARLIDEDRKRKQEFADIMNDLWSHLAAGEDGQGKDAP